MGLSDKLSKSIDIKGVSNYRIAKDLGISASTIANYRNGKTVPESDILNKLANYLGVSLDYLLKDNGLVEPLNEYRKSDINARKVDATTINTTTAPLISQYAAAGYLQGFSDPEYIEQQPLYIAAQKFSGGNYVAFEIRGDSMDDGLKHSIGNGDLVLGKELKREYWTSRLHFPKVFVIVHKQDGILCKEIIAHDVDQGIITCHSYNPEHRDFTLNLQDIAQLFYIKEKKTGY